MKNLVELLLELFESLSEQADVGLEAFDLQVPALLELFVSLLGELQPLRDPV